MVSGTVSTDLVRFDVLSNHFKKYLSVVATDSDGISYTSTANIAKLFRDAPLIKRIMEDMEHEMLMKRKCETVGGDDEESRTFDKWRN